MRAAPVIALLSLWIGHAAYAANSFTVATDGDDGADGMTHPWQTLQHAADSVHAGDTVTIRAGHYAGFHLDGSRTTGISTLPITFSADRGTVIDAPFSGGSDGIFLDGASAAVAYVTISGFEIDGMPGIGIRAVSANHLLIQRNRVQSSLGPAILGDGLQDSRVQNCLLVGNQTGVSLLKSTAADGAKRNLVINDTIIQKIGSGWGVSLGAMSQANTVSNDILMNDGPGGAIAISDPAALSESNFNVVVDRFSLSGGTDPISLASWQASGFDPNSTVASSAMLFVAPALNDYHLIAGAPAIDRASPSGAPSDDLDGNPRPTGSADDIGAYEYCGFCQTDGGTAADGGGTGDGGTNLGTQPPPGSPTLPPRKTGCELGGGDFAGAPALMVLLGALVLRSRRRS